MELRSKLNNFLFVSILSKNMGIIRDLPTGSSHDIAKEIEQATSLPWQENSYSEYTSKGY